MNLIHNKTDTLNVVKSRDHLNTTPAHTHTRRDESVCKKKDCWMSDFFYHVSLSRQAGQIWKLKKVTVTLWTLECLCDINMPYASHWSYHGCVRV